MHCWPFLAAGVGMDSKEAPHDVAMAGSISSSVWGAAAHYRHLLQQQQQQLEQQQHGLDAQEEVSPDLAPATSPGRRSSEASEHEEEPAEHEDSSSQDVLEKLRQQVANVTARTRKLSGDGAVSPSLEEEASRGGAVAAQPLPAPAAALSRQHALSPQSLLAASMGHHPASLVPLPQLGVAGYGATSTAAGGGGASTSPAPPREPASSPVSSTAHSPRQAGAQQAAAWNFEEQFKQLYEIDDNPKRKEFLDELFRFMQNRGSPINRLPIMAKQVLDLYELYNLVVARGGLVEVINKKLWQEIIKGLKLPSSITSAAFTLRTQYMKYLYPWECQKEGLSSPAELQAAVDGNRREGRRSTYSSSSYAELVQRSPLMASQMGGGFGLTGGLPTSLHQRGLSPLSLIGNRATVPNGTGHPVPPSSPFLPGVRPPMLPTANDTLMTLWSLYNRGRPGGPGSPPPPPVPPRQPETAPHPPHATTPAGAPQCEALNLGVQKNRQEREREAREREHERAMEAERERYREHAYEQETEERARKKRSRRDEHRSSSEEGSDMKPPRMKHMKMCFNTNGVSSFELSMEVENVVYRGVLFATSSPPSLEQRLSPSPAALCNSTDSIPNLKDPFKLAV